MSPQPPKETPRGSTLTQAEIVNVVALLAVLQADLGAHRKIGWHRIIRPILLAAAIVPLFLDKVATQGSGLTVELCGVAAGVLGGLAAMALTRVYRSGKTAKPVSAAGRGHALLWIVVVGARAAFSYGSQHWFRAQISSWSFTNNVSAPNITDGLIIMAVAMLVVCTIGLAVRSLALRRATAPTPEVNYSQA